MYELYTLGGGTYLVDLLNAAAAITGGGAYMVLAQLVGVAGLGWVLLRTASAARGRTTPSGSCCSSPSGAP